MAWRRRRRRGCWGSAPTRPGNPRRSTVGQPPPTAPADLTGIVLRFAKTGAAMIDNNALKSHCAQYILPLAAVDRKVLPQDVLGERRTEPQIERLSKVTRMVYDDEPEKS